MSTLHHHRDKGMLPIRGRALGAVVVLSAVAFATPAWGDCPETLTLAEMVECFGASGAGDESKGTADEPRQAEGPEEVAPAPRAEDGANHDVDC